MKTKPQRLLGDLDPTPVSRFHYLERSGENRVAEPYWDAYTIRQTYGYYPERGNR